MSQEYEIGTHIDLRYINSTTQRSADTEPAETTMFERVSASLYEVGTHISFKDVRHIPVVFA